MVGDVGGADEWTTVATVRFVSGCVLDELRHGGRLAPEILDQAVGSVSWERTLHVAHVGRAEQAIERFLAGDAQAPAIALLAPRRAVRDRAYGAREDWSGGAALHALPLCAGGGFSGIKTSTDSRLVQVECRSDEYL